LQPGYLRVSRNARVVCYRLDLRAFYRPHRRTSSRDSRRASADLESVKRVVATSESHQYFNSVVCFTISHAKFALLNEKDRMIAKQITQKMVPHISPVNTMVDKHL